MPIQSITTPASLSRRAVFNGEWAYIDWAVCSNGGTCGRFFHSCQPWRRRFMPLIKHQEDTHAFFYSYISRKWVRTKRKPLSGKDFCA
jgi:hypothetical protein